MDNASIQASVETIFKACKGAGTDEEAIINVIGNRNLNQRHQIRLAYYAKYKKDLMDVFDSELSGDFRYLVKNLFLGPIQILAAELFNTLSKTGSAGGNVNDIICCLSPTEITALKEAYLEVLQHEKVKDKTRTLEKDLEKETKGPHRDFILKFIQTKRREFTPGEIDAAASSGNWSSLVDMEKVGKNAEVIFNAGAGKRGKGLDAEVTRVLTTSNALEIRALYDHFLDIYGTSLVDFLTNAFKNPLRDAYNTVIMTAVDLRLLLIAQIYNTMKGAGTDEKTLSRIFIIRSEIDLQNLKLLYKEKIGRSLAEMVKSDTSSDYRSLLLTLLGEK